MIRRCVRLALIVCLLMVSALLPRQSSAAESPELDNPQPDCVAVEMDRTPIGEYPIVLDRVHNAADVETTYKYAQSSKAEFSVLTKIDQGGWQPSGQIKTVVETRVDLSIIVPPGYNDIYMNYSFDVVEYVLMCGGTQVPNSSKLFVEVQQATSGLWVRSSAAPHANMEAATCEDVIENSYGQATILGKGSEITHSRSDSFASKVQLGLSSGGVSAEMSYEVTLTDFITHIYKVPLASQYPVYLRVATPEWSYVKPCAQELGFVTNMSGWQNVQGLWNNTNSFGVNGANVYEDNGFYMADSNSQAFTYLADVRLTESNDGAPAAGLVFKAAQKDNPQSQAYGVVLIGGPNGGVKLFQSNPYVVLSQVNMAISLQQLYRLRVDVHDGRIQVYLNDIADGNTPLIDVADPEPNLHGFRGLVAYRTQAVFQNVFTYSYAQPADDFNTNLLDPWVKFPVTGAWSYGPEGLRGAGAGDNFYTSRSEASDGVFTGDIRLDSNFAAAALVFRATDRNNPSAGSYAVNVSTVNGGQVKLFKFPYQPLAIRNVPITASQHYTLSVEFVGSSIRVFFSGYSATQPLIETIDSSYLAGYLGLNVYDGEATFQNVTIAEPTVTDGFVTNLAQPWQSAGGSWLRRASGLSGTATGDAFYTSSSVPGSTFSYESDVMLTSINPADERAAALTFNVQDPMNPAAGSYAVNINTRNGGEVKLFRFPYVPLDRASTTIEPNTSYTLLVRKEQSLIKVYLNGNLVIMASDSTYAGGYLGLNVYQTSAQFQNTRFQ